MPVKSPPGRGFGERLREAFKGAGNSEIARQLGLTPSALTNYMKGRLPPPEVLLTIAELTDCSIHWLLTGEGEADLDPLRFLDDRTRSTVQTVASKLDMTPEGLLAELITEALTHRGAELLSNYRELDGAQIDQLVSILKIIDVEGAQASLPAGREHPARRSSS